MWCLSHTKQQTERKFVYLLFTLGSKLFVNIPGIQADPFWELCKHQLQCSEIVWTCLMMEKCFSLGSDSQNAVGYAKVMIIRGSTVDVLGGFAGQKMSYKLCPQIKL